jgi:tRNA pseudouridine32 synthase/23S rRNA pseudouridine746 synthase
MTSHQENSAALHEGMGCISDFQGSGTTSDDSTEIVAGLRIVYRDGDLVAIDKPPGLRSTPAFLASTGTHGGHPSPAESIIGSSSSSSSGGGSSNLSVGGSKTGAKKRSRQERFSEVLQSLPALSSSSSDTKTTGFSYYLQKLAKESRNVPRKKKNFRSYAKRSLRVDNDEVVEQLWERIQGAVRQEERREGMALTDSVLSRIQIAIADCATAVHRLDCETSGMMLVALTQGASTELSRQFRDGEVKKTYVAVVHGSLCEATSGTISRALRADPSNRPRQVVDDLDGKPATTKYRRAPRNAGIESLPPGFDRVALNPITGRTHQLRVHLKSIGHTIVGDSLYESPGDVPTDITRTLMPQGKQRLLLHAQQIHFKHPTSGKPIMLTSTCPF